MTLTATYDPATARVRLACDGLTGAATVTIERSGNGGISWVTVRGCTALAVDGDALADEVIDDYEFADRTANIYRCVAGEALPVDGTFETGVDGWTADLSTFVQDDTHVHGGSHAALLTSAGAAADFADAHAVIGPVPGLSVWVWPADATAAAAFGFEVDWFDAGNNLLDQSISTDVPAAGQWTQITISDPAPVGASYGVLQFWLQDVADGTKAWVDDLSVAGAGPATQTATVTPVLSRVWLKSPTRPFLNRAVTVIGPGDPGYASRSSASDIVGSSRAIGVEELRAGPTWTLQLRTETADEAQTLEWVLAAGGIMFIHAPRGSLVRSDFVLIGDVATSRPKPTGTIKYWQLPCTSITPPGPDVAAAANTWTSLLEQFATWQDVLDAFSTWGDLRDNLVGQPSETIV